MEKSYTDRQISSALRQVATGTPVSEVARKMGATVWTIRRWKKKYAGMGTSDIRQLKKLKEENRRLKKRVADLSLDKRMLQYVLSQNVLSPDHRRKLVSHLVNRYRASERKVCRALGFHRGTIRWFLR